MDSSTKYTEYYDDLLSPPKNYIKKVNVTGVYYGII
jgi:hypothetical protein